MSEIALDLDWVEKALVTNKKIMAQVEASVDMDNLDPDQEHAWHVMQREMMMLTNLKRLMKISKNEDLGYILRVLQLTDSFLKILLKRNPEIEKHDLFKAMDKLREKGIIE